MTFETYLAGRARGRLGRAERRPGLKVNPAVGFADEFARLLQRHLNTVEAWIDGTIKLKSMREAMKFFASEFPGQYTATPGRLLYRGQKTYAFDGQPRSYSYKRDVAEGFARAWWAWFGSNPGILIERKVCDRCQDAAAFRFSLDLGKLLKVYATHVYGLEKEVVILNTPPRGETVKVYRIVSGEAAA